MLMFYEGWIGGGGEVIQQPGYTQQRREPPPPCGRSPGTIPTPPPIPLRDGTWWPWRGRGPARPPRSSSRASTASGSTPPTSAPAPSPRPLNVGPPINRALATVQLFEIFCIRTDTTYKVIVRNRHKGLFCNCWVTKKSSLKCQTLNIDFPVGSPGPDRRPEGSVPPVLSPTRELALQTVRFFRQLGRLTNLRVTLAHPARGASGGGSTPRAGPVSRGRLGVRGPMPLPREPSISRCDQGVGEVKGPWTNKGKLNLT